MKDRYWQQLAGQAVQEQRQEQERQTNHQSSVLLEQAVQERQRMQVLQNWHERNESQEEEPNEQMTNTHKEKHENKSIQEQEVC